MTVKECYEQIGSDYAGVLKRLGSEALVKRFALKFLKDPSYQELKDALITVSYTHLDVYKRQDLVKLDILVNKEEVDALSFIVFADTAYERGRRMCEKLKEEIPRQLFEIPIQAAIGSKAVSYTHLTLPEVFASTRVADTIEKFAEAFHPE